MPMLPIPALQALINKLGGTVKTAQSKPVNANESPKQRHLMHYLLKGLGQLPTPVLERLNRYLDAPCAEQYPHADAHLRLIIGFNNKLKRPLQGQQLLKLRRKFAADAVALQDPKVWQQRAISTDTDTDINTENNVKSKTKKGALAKDSTASWQDKNIANADGGEMTIRCYQASDARSATDQTAMLFLHGGGFCIGDINTHHEFCHTLCAQTGWAVVSVDYRLAPEHPAPTALRDCIAAYGWLAEHAHTLGALPSRLLLSGDSAGGCLAILVAQQVTATHLSQWQNLGLDIDAMTDLLQDLPRPLAQLPLYPVTDIAANYPSWDLYGQGWLLDHEDVAVFDSAYMQRSHLAQSHALTSPMRGDSTHLCPSYVVAAELDILRDEALAFAKQLQAAEIKVQSYTVLGAPHGFIHLMSVHDKLGHQSTYIINEFARFVRQLLAVEPL